MVVWSQIANAITMVSPLITWWHHRHKQSTQCKNLRKTLIRHIPISFMYHLISGLGVNGLTRWVLKACDLCLVHFYALQVNNTLRQKQLPLTKASYVLNTYCILRVCQGHEDTRIRMTSLYICSYDAIRHIDRGKRHILILGSLSSIFFYYDEYLRDMGHSVFHVLLGRLHHKVLMLT